MLSEQNIKASTTSFFSESLDSALDEDGFLLHAARVQIEELARRSSDRRAFASGFADRCSLPLADLTAVMRGHKHLPQAFSSRFLNAIRSAKDTYPGPVAGALDAGGTGEDPEADEAFEAELFAAAEASEEEERKAEETEEGKPEPIEAQAEPIEEEAGEISEHAIEETEETPAETEAPPVATPEPHAEISDDSLSAEIAPSVAVSPSRPAELPLDLAPGCYGSALTYKDTADECRKCVFAPRCKPVHEESVAILKARLAAHPSPAMLAVRAAKGRKMKVDRERVAAARAEKVAARATVAAPAPSPSKALDDLAAGYRVRLDALRTATSGPSLSHSLRKLKGREADLASWWVAQQMARSNHGPKPTARQVADSRTLMNRGAGEFNKKQAENALARIAGLESAGSVWCGIA